MDYLELTPRSPEHHATDACPSVKFVVPEMSVAFGISCTRADCEVELFSSALSAPFCPFQMTLGLVNGEIGLLFARSLVRMMLGTDPGGWGSGPVNSYAASPATCRSLLRR